MRVSKSKLVVHAFLVVYAAILAYVILGLVFNFYISADIFFDLSFALLFFAIAQAMYELGIKRAALFFILTTVIGYAAEVLGTNTGFPFGKYSYGDILGEKVLGVPVVVPVVWFVITYISMSMMGGKGRLISTSALAAFGVVSWDLLIDPMFSSPSYGYWSWTNNQSVPALSGVPLTNFLGWYVLALIMISLFLYVATKSGQTTIKRKNTPDSIIVYSLLMIDGAAANISLGHTLVVILGVTAMLIFIATSMNRSRRAESQILKDVSMKAQE